MSENIKSRVDKYEEAIRQQKFRVAEQAKWDHNNVVEPLLSVPTNKRNTPSPDERYSDESFEEEVELSSVIEEHKVFKYNYAPTLQKARIVLYSESIIGLTAIGIYDQAHQPVEEKCIDCITFTDRTGSKVLKSNLQVLVSSIDENINASD